jgi:hypothetical protein
VAGHRQLKIRHRIYEMQYLVVVPRHGRRFGTYWRPEGALSRVGVRRHCRNARNVGIHEPADVSGMAANTRHDGVTCGDGRLRSPPMLRLCSGLGHLGRVL